MHFLRHNFFIKTYITTQNVISKKIVTQFKHTPDKPRAQKKLSETRLKKERYKHIVPKPRSHEPHKQIRCRTSLLYRVKTREAHTWRQLHA